MKFATIIKQLIVLVIAIGIIQFIFYTAMVLPYPFDWEDTEGDHLNYSLLLSEGISPYTDNNEFPMLFFLYPPFFHLLLVPAVKLFGPSLLFGRIVSLLAIMGISTIIFLWTKEKTKRTDLALAAGAIFLLPKLIVKSLLLNRVNALFIFLVLLGFWLVHKAEQKKQGNWLGIAAGGVFFLAVYTKQLAAIPIILIYGSLLVRRTKLALISFAAFIIPSIVTLVLLEQWTNGLFLYNILQTTSDNTALGLKYLLTEGFFVTIYMFPALLSLPWLWKECKNIFSVDFKKIVKGLQKINLRIIYLISGFFIFLLGANSGATFDYAVPFMIGLLLITASVFPRFEKQGWACMIILVCVIIQLVALSNSGGYYVPDKASLATGEEIVEHMKEIEGPLLTERVVSFSLLAKKDVAIESSMISTLYNSTVWSPTTLEKCLEHKCFPTLFANTKLPFGEEHIAKLVEENYQPTKTYTFRIRGTYMLVYAFYTPKKEVK